MTTTKEWEYRAWLVMVVVVIIVIAVIDGHTLAQYFVELLGQAVHLHESIVGERSDHVQQYHRQQVLR